jgi:hypothetical protein
MWVALREGKDWLDNNRYEGYLFENGANDYLQIKHGCYMHYN